MKLWDFRVQSFATIRIPALRSEVAPFEKEQKQKDGDEDESEDQDVSQHAPKRAVAHLFPTISKGNGFCGTIAVCTGIVGFGEILWMSLLFVHQATSWRRFAIASCFAEGALIEKLW
jgi:hypothetical protein